MQIILKPLGAIAIGAAILTLSFIVIRNNRTNTSSNKTDALGLASLSSTAVIAQTAPVSDAVIYDDALQNGWENFTWAKKNDFASKDTVSEGMCIQVTPGAFEALYFHHAPISVANYDRISFRIRGDKTRSQQLKIIAQLDNKEKSNSAGQSAPSSQVLTNKPVEDAFVNLTPPPDKWKTVVVSLKELAVEGKPNFIGFWLQETAGNKTAPTFYVDDVRFLRPTDATPAD